ncbi:hypothetical protein ACFLTP_08005 [Chloroflexota bacterium]
MVDKTITVLDPTVQPQVTKNSLAPRLHDLNDKVIGFLWNQKSNGDILLLSIKEQLSQKFHLAGTVWQQKSLAAIPADATIVGELIHSSDVVINGQGD